MNLHFRVLRLENFKAFAGPVKFDLQACGVGLHFIRGDNQLEPSLHSNGAGKSSLWDALIWCLYGCTVQNLRNPDIRPWSGDKQTRVSLSLLCDNESHRIIRSTFPNRLVLDNNVVGQEQIDQLIGLDFDIFTHTILMGQGRPLFLELAPRDKLALFTTVLELDVWEKRSENAAKKTSDIDRSISAHQGEIDVSDGQLRQLKQLIEDGKGMRDEWDQNKARLERAEEVETGRLKQQLEQVQKLRSEADLAYDSAMTEIKDLRRRRDQTADYWDAAHAERMKAERTLEETRDMIGELTVKLKRNLQPGETCPTCGQEMTPKGLRAHKENIKDKITRLRGLVDVGIPSAIESSLDDLSRQLGDIKNTIKQFEEKAEAANDRMIALDPRIASIEARIAVIRQNRERQNQEENPFEVQLGQLRAKRGEALERKRVAEEKITGLQQRRERTVFWVKGFKEVRLFIIEEALQELELASNALLDQFGLLGWHIRYSIERETQSGNISRALNVDIKSPHNPEPVRFESWSGGQQQRLRLIGSLALSDVLLERAGIHSSLEILDEPSRSITPEGVRDMVEALADRAAQRRSQIYYTDHSAIESSRFASTICVTLDETGAHL